MVAFFALSAFLANMGREITKDIEDLEFDKGIKTSTPMLIGKETASLLVLLFYTLGTLIAAYVWFSGMAKSFVYIALVAVSAAIFALAYWQLNTGNAAKSQRYSKGAMFIALLAYLAAVL
jgi:geranylgeranylglycerol-phosphate geranylgeranyltransferase